MGCKLRAPSCSKLLRAVWVGVAGRRRGQTSNQTAMPSRGQGPTHKVNSGRLLSQEPWGSAAGPSSRKLSSLSIPLAFTPNCPVQPTGLCRN